MGDHESGGLREKKKRKLREQIRSAAITMFTEHGYRQTSMEQIAAAAEVAPRTVYRYFPTKDALVLTDEDDELMLERFRAELETHTPLEALGRSFRSVMLAPEADFDARRNALISAEPELQAATLRHVIGLADHYADAVVEYTGRPQDRDAALALAGAALGIALVTLRWDGGGDLDTAAQMRRLDDSLRRLEHGFDF